MGPIFIRKPCPNTHCQSEEIDYDNTRHRWWCRKCSLCGPSNDPSGALWDGLPRAQDEQVVAAMQKAIDALNLDLFNAQSCIRNNIDTSTARIIERETLNAEIAGLRSALAVEISAAQALGRECDSLREELKDIEESHREVMAEPCPGDDRVHCTCVPALRREIGILREKLRELRASTHAEDPGVEATIQCLTRYYDEEQETTAEHREKLDAAAGVVRSLMRGDCWCEVAIGNPMYGGRHTEACDRARAFIARADRECGS